MSIKDMNNNMLLKTSQINREWDIMILNKKKSLLRPSNNQSSPPSEEKGKTNPTLPTFNYLGGEDK